MMDCAARELALGNKCFLAINMNQVVCIDGKYLGVSKHFWSLTKYLKRSIFERTFIYNVKPTIVNEDISFCVFNSDYNQFIDKVIQKSNPNRVYVWNGKFDYQQQFLSSLQRHGIQVNFIEVAWFDQKDFYYVDPLGVNGDSQLSICGSTLQVSIEDSQVKSFVRAYRERLPKNRSIQVRHRVLVVFQVDTDSNIRFHSDFNNMKEFFEVIDQWFPEHYEFLVRLHPKGHYPYQIDSAQRAVTISDGNSLLEDIASCDFVVGVNSTVLLQSVALGVPALAFGRGVFSDFGAIQSIDWRRQPFRVPELDDAKVIGMMTVLLDRQRPIPMDAPPLYTKMANFIWLFLSKYTQRFLDEKYFS